ncbi:MAG: hypothetical protein DRI56_02760 [Chloroflexota bacterium]|nr:MAG: hypothetical protein B6243_09060 [Anaerolineaceae bacterium 4572_5.2]RLD10377.1 MAG: hypothetical protein DRI56_02760 [Chloroflexota bacterium]
MEQKSNILIVEDDLDVAEMLEAYFRVQGYQVSSVNWGEDGVKACRKDLPDLVILDIRLPDIDGFEVARRLRKNNRTAGIPIIFLTEKRTRADRLEGLSLGADDYITKPFDVQELRLRVRNSLTRSSQRAIKNPVTGLPEDALVDERLQECLETTDPWVLLVISLENLDIFREQYGFVASDDVLRAVSLMIYNAVRDMGGTADFVGHINPTDFIVVTAPDTLDAIGERVRKRLKQALEYFYPLKDRPHKDGASRLALRMGLLSNENGPFEDVNDLKTLLLQRRVGKIGS